MKVRHPSQAGSFYADNANDLKKQIEISFTHKLGPGKTPIAQKGPRNIVGLICPHAGYAYSGPVAAHSYHRLAADGKPDVIVIFGPNHFGKGSGLAVMTEGAWRTPLGDVQIDEEIAKKILHQSKIIDVDDLAHLHEHSIEVQLPFLQYLYGSALKFVPISFLMQDFESSCEVGQAVAEVLKGKNALIIASTDMSHYEPYETVEKKDRKALDALEKLDEREFYSIVESYHITACGYGPVVALTASAKHLGAEKCQVLCYKTSGDITGDFSSVVGYASAIFTLK
ncbi:MAG: AmmeMemoRadiSam system protein B [Candidatus Bathyarchaeota archaeon]|nr:MAG: AmmeMemoRadiSam system protein B [Candidatus Bathyarchaeota archaeon]